MLKNHLMFFGCWVLFYALHSVMATESFKSKQPFKAQTYRLIYSLFSTFSLFFILLLGASIYSGFVLPPSQISLSIGLMVTTFGLFVIKRAFRNYSFRTFMGFKKQKESDHTLKKDKIQGIIRHPLYSGTALILLGYFIYNPLLINLISLLSLFLYLPIGIRLEEKKMIREFGDEYRQYKQEVPAIFPKLKRS